MNKKPVTIALSGAALALMLAVSPALANDSVRDEVNQARQDVKGIKIEAQKDIEEIRKEAREDIQDVRNDVRDTVRDNMNRNTSTGGMMAPGSMNGTSMNRDGMARMGMTGAAMTGNSDAAVEDRVKRALQSYNDVSVEADNGVVKLGGSVASQQDKDMAISRAREVTGVTSVRDDISVKSEKSGSLGAYLDDAGVTGKVKGKFLGQKGLDSLDIHVETVNGVVTLSGDVENPAQVSLAEDVAKEADGVVRVVNNLQPKR